MPEKDSKSPYVDYEYYTGDYHGKQIDRDSFPHVKAMTDMRSLTGIRSASRSTGRI